jgi:hypothetical protein
VTDLQDTAVLPWFVIAIGVFADERKRGTCAEVLRMDGFTIEASDETAFRPWMFEAWRQVATFDEGLGLAPHTRSIIDKHEGFNVSFVIDFVNPPDKDGLYALIRNKKTNATEQIGTSDTTTWALTNNE